MAERFLRDDPDRMIRMILPCRIDFAKVDGAWKPGQNKPDPARRDGPWDREMTCRRNPRTSPRKPC